MAPRTYTLGRRAETAAATRERILERALELYRDRGVAGATMRAIADRADVSRGTILHHFGSSDGLLAAALDFVVDSLDLPDERLFDGLDDRDSRIRAFVDAMLAFQERSTPFWSIFEGEMERPVLQEREAAYWMALARLQAAALGPDLAADARANAALLGLIHPATVGTIFWSFERAGLGREEARTLLGDLAVDAVRRIADRGTGGGGST